DDRVRIDYRLGEIAGGVVAAHPREIRTWPRWRRKRFATHRVARKALKLDEDVAATLGITVGGSEDPAMRDPALAGQLLHRQSIRCAICCAAAGHMRCVPGRRGFGEQRGASKHDDTEEGFSAYVARKSVPRRARRRCAAAADEEARKTKDPIARAATAVIRE